MNKMTLAGLAALMMVATGCQSVNRDVATPAVIGGVGGAAIGAAASGDIGGALIGGALGTAAGALLGSATSRPNECVYRAANGQRYVAECPAGYRR